ncbi:hypothetical protein [uncultured Caulobacter sp.]|uniref:hypothetical protein n=1 Tax=uncultured Caulobacter sp. TaxID=158749 RepID=UPI0026276F53|nr:hypothetical protein [uncultured Caulobacter sp.]
MARRLSLVIATGAVAVVIPAAARAADPPLYVVDAVFVQAGAANAVEGAQAALTSRAASDYFKAQFRQVYPSVVDRIDDGARTRTFVVSLQVPRVSEYAITKVNGTVERQLFLTASLYFTNIVTGEVLFTYNATAYRADVSTVNAPAPRLETRQARVFELYQSLIADLVQKSRHAFKPFEINARVQKGLGDLVQIDKGVADGLSFDDALISPTGELKVVFVEGRYALAKPQLGGAPRTGSTWTKYSTNRLTDVARPRAVIRIDQNGSPFADAAIEQMIADSLGEVAPITIIPVNPAFSQVIETVRQNTDIRADRFTVRSAPDLFIRIIVLPPYAYELPTNLTYKTVRTTRAVVLAEVVDVQGRVQFAGLGQSILRDEITEGMSYQRQARFEVAIRNALFDLARGMNSGLKPDQADLLVEASADKSISVADPKGLMRSGMSVLVLRGAAEPMPIWSATINSAGQGRAEAALTMPFYAGAPTVRPGDLIRVTRLGRLSPLGVARTRPCGTSESLGARRVPGFEATALNRWASGASQDVDLSNAAADASKALEATGLFRAAGGLAGEAAKVCVEPVVRADLTQETCDPQGVCRSDITLRVTYRLRRDGQVIFRDGLETVVHTAGYPKDTPATDREVLIDNDVALASADLAQTLAAKSEFQKALLGQQEGK